MPIPPLTLLCLALLTACGGSGAVHPLTAAGSTPAAATRPEILRTSATHTGLTVLPRSRGGGRGDGMPATRFPTPLSALDPQVAATE